MLAMMLRENDHMRRWVDEAWRAAPSSQAQPWRLLIGWDEFVPGNKQAIQNSRKTMVLSFSFGELGHRLQFDAAWLTTMAIRASVVKQVSGGWSAILRSFLRLLLLGAEGLQVGVAIPSSCVASRSFCSPRFTLSSAMEMAFGRPWSGWEQAP